MKYTKIKFLIFDFDGVFTDNKVLVSEEGKEFVICNRSDGLAIQVLKKLKLKMFILSSEKNNVVQLRGKKLGIKVYNNIKDKYMKIIKLNHTKQLDIKKTLYVGNDINDLKSIKLCKYSCCPKDSHPKIKKVVNKILNSKGGEGVVREIVENLFKVDIEKILYK